jgi:hypothetical protein
MLTESCRKGGIAGDDDQVTAVAHRISQRLRGLN